MLPAGERVKHAFMVHGDAVAHADGGELNGRAAGHADASLHCLRNLIQMHMPRDNFVFGADHANDRPVQFLLGQSQSPEQGTVGDAVHAAFHQVTSHSAPHSLSLLKYKTLASSIYIRSRLRMASSALSPE